jgi:hypothetical protein
VNRKSTNFLDKLPKGVQPKAKAALHGIHEAETRKEAEKAFDLFLATYEAKYPKAAECLAKVREALLVFYDFPAEHWRRIRTTNPIESTFASMRLRTVKTKGSGSRMACSTMVFKLLESASRRWRLLNGSPKLQAVISRMEYVDGIEAKDAALIESCPQLLTIALPHAKGDVRGNELRPRFHAVPPDSVQRARPWYRGGRGVE